MVRLGKRLLNTFDAGNKKGLQRNDFSKKTKEITLLMQGYRCNDCHAYLYYPEFHHKDGNRSNNAIWNCEALCPNCHAKKTRKKR